jgi:hypothetical protein
MKYCTKCGKELFDEAVICPGCGCPTGPMPAPVTSSYTTSSHDLVLKLSERMKTSGIIWIVIAVIQIIIGLCGTILPLVIGVLNIISAVKDMNYSKAILEDPRGIVSNFEPITSPIITLVYNLIIGGVIGVAGSAYYFIALRSFVMEHKEAFLALENNCAPQAQQYTHM